MTRLYLGGPMRQIPDLNYPAFDKAADQLRHAGYDVFNPADADRKFYEMLDRQPTIRECLNTDLGWITIFAEGVALLDGWQASSGACAEVAAARAIDIPYRSVDDWLKLAERKAA